MNLVSWSPFQDMEGFFDRYSRLFRNRYPLAGEFEFPDTDMSWRPVADISETKREYVIKAELPEVEKKDVHISLENGMLTISGERRMEKESEGETQHRIESFYGKFSRSFALPSDVDEKKISAESQNGVLKVHLPKTKMAKPKQIEISIN